MRILYDHKNYINNKLHIITSKQLYLESINKKNSSINIHDYSFNIITDKKKLIQRKINVIFKMICHLSIYI